MFWKRLRIFFVKTRPVPKITIIIPFSSKDPGRKRNLRWLRKYWKSELPEAELIIGRSKSKVFCKAEAVNDAFRRSRGKVIAMLDADAYLDGKVVEEAANKILDNMDIHLWMIPYRHLYRLTENITEKIIMSDPANPLRLPSPPPIEDVEQNGFNSKYGHRYGAMAMMFPREAIETLGCFDERFKGWGGEDVALLRALDTLYGKHKTTNNDIYHLWHPFIGDSYKTRVWDGQERGRVNNNLANKYHRASRRPESMRRLVDEGCRERKYK